MYKINDFLEIKSARGGTFSPGGDKVAFLSNGTGTFQLYLVDRAGGRPRRLTDYADSLAPQICFSPVKEEIIFGKAQGGDEKYQIYLYNVVARQAHPLTNRLDSIYRWGGWSRDGKFITYASNERNGKDFDVYVMDVASGSARLIFDQGGWCDALGFSPSGRWVVVKQQRTFVDNDLYTVDLRTSEIELLTPHQGLAQYHSVRWRSDERGFFFISNEGRDLAGLSFYDRKKKKSEFVLTPAWELEGIALTKDAEVLAVISNEVGYGALTLYDASSRRHLPNQNFPKGQVAGLRWSNDSQYLVFSFQSATRNSDIWIWSRLENKCWPLTKSPSAVPAEALVEPELIHYESFDGLSVPAFIFWPKKVFGPWPAIVNIHGGPEGQYCPYFDALTQYFVYRGYAVVAPNVRGSSGYGKRYLALDDREKRMDSIKDLEFLHKYLAHSGKINPQKIALMGASYGGYMTLAGLAFQSDLWAAGVDIVGVSNMVTFLENTSAWRRAVREAEYGYLKTDKKFLESISPLNFIDNIKAPLFIIHGKNDPRVPLSEAEQMHQQLKKRGLKTELLVYDDEGHGLAKLKNRLDAYPKIAEFLGTCLRPIDSLK